MELLAHATYAEVAMAFCIYIVGFISGAGVIGAWVARRQRTK